MGQFINHAVNLGHQIWSWSSNQHPAVHQLPASTWRRILTLRKMDAICVRIENCLPILGYSRWSLAPYKQLIGSPVIVWEFNTAPEYGLVIGKSQAEVQEEIAKLRHYGRGCDLAVCVSEALADYVKTNLGIERVLTVPNGSDPQIFNPNVTPIARIPANPNQLNVVWIGSADLSWHNFDLLRDTARILWEQNNDDSITFHIIGRGHSLMKDMPLNVHYYGSEHYRLLPQWLAAMDVGLCLYRPGPADYNSPLKVFDYMASELAVVGTKHPQLGTIFKQLDCADLLVNHNDPQKLANTLTHLAQNRDRVSQLGKLSRQLIMNHYNWSRAVKDTVKGIESISNNKKRSQFLIFRPITKLS